MAPIIVLHTATLPLVHPPRTLVETRRIVHRFPLFTASSPPSFLSHLPWSPCPLVFRERRRAVATARVLFHVPVFAPPPSVSRPHPNTRCIRVVACRVHVSSVHDALLSFASCVCRLLFNAALSFCSASAVSRSSTSCVRCSLALLLRRGRRSSVGTNVRPLSCQFRIALRLLPLFVSFRLRSCFDSFACASGTLHAARAPPPKLFCAASCLRTLPTCVSFGFFVHAHACIAPRRYRSAAVFPLRHQRRVSPSISHDDGSFVDLLEPWAAVC